MTHFPPLGVRWTIGDVSDEGIEGLRLSIWGAWRLFERGTSYAVCYNTISLDRLRASLGAMPCEVLWHDSARDVPSFLRAHFDATMAEGVGWKFAPLHMFPDRHELSLDNDCILWSMPAAVRLWLEQPEPPRCVIAEDVRPCFGMFAPHCGSEPRNSGIRGLPPAYPLEHELRSLLSEVPGVLSSELDEQGLQVAAVARRRAPEVVTVREVSICSPFPPHLPNLGTCGAHFVGLNARQLPWSLEGRPASDWTREHWGKHREELYTRVGLKLRATG
jgi:hypothetical protein